MVSPPKETLLEFFRNRAVAYQARKQERLVRSKVDSFIYACVLAASSGRGKPREESKHSQTSKLFHDQDSNNRVLHPSILAKMTTQPWRISELNEFLWKP